MIQLFFEIEHQKIKRTDTYKPVAKSVNYLYAHFDFLTSEWHNLIKTAIFRTDSTAYEVILDADDNCLVPWEATQNEGDIYISVFAGDLITVNKSRAHVYESGYGDDLESSHDPTPGVYQQILEKLENIDGGLFTDWQSEVEEDVNSTS